MPFSISFPAYYQQSKEGGKCSHVHGPENIDGETEQSDRRQTGRENAMECGGLKRVTGVDRYVDDLKF